MINLDYLEPGDKIRHRYGQINKVISKKILHDVDLNYKLEMEFGILTFTKNGQYYLKRESV